MKKRISTLLIALCILTAELFSQQIAIPRIELMPNQPAPYLMRNWKDVALGYDSLVYNQNLTGQYLPLIRFYDNTINYTNHGSYGLHTVVGTTSSSSGEAINVIPSVISATLAGVDKSNQNGINYVLMCEEYFNKQNEENVYLNHPDTKSGDDWWYETMPNIFFYQLYDLYPGTGDFENQFITIADRWLEAVDKMGGSTTPWIVPNMNYRAWDLITMTGNSVGVKEPEAAGVIGWMLYNAYIKTGEDKYRIGAEWCLEFLSGLITNPSYELQLAYGAYAAARMNAELGTNYNIEKILNWCFNIGPLREWGAIVGNWGGYDVSGIIGESSGNDYGFLMNTFEQAGALVPLVRYDERFARAIGKWMLNASNAARLFYPNYLPDTNQDSEEWSHQFDPHAYIGHEAIREQDNGKSPYATGDAISGGWGSTNLALYGSSHVGIFGGIIETTDVELILKLDLLKTDYFAKSAQPSFLLFNPYNETKTVTINVGNDVKNIYDAVSNTMISSNVSGNTAININANEAVIIVMLPAGAIMRVESNVLYVNDIIADYNAGQTIINNAPRIKSLSVPESNILINSSAKIYCTAFDKDSDPLNYTWLAENGTITGDSAIVSYNAPASEGIYRIICRATDNKGGTAEDTLSIVVVSSLNNPPTISSFFISEKKVDLNSSVKLVCNASDADNDTLSYTWYVQVGSMLADGNELEWISPSVPGNYFIICSVSDGNEVTTDSVEIIVRDFSVNQTGSLLFYLSFNGNTSDESGNSNNVFAFQGTFASDRFNNPNSAYYFDGNDDHMQVKNTTQLNPENSIAINFWIKINSFFERESYPISHGNWENRWKISLTNNKIRWTIKTTTGVKDLDSETEFVEDSIYNINASYNGSDMEIYVNGRFDSHSSFSGKIKTTTLDLMIAQTLPANYNYGFNGILDEIRIYDYALSDKEIKTLSDIPTAVLHDEKIPQNYYLSQNFPNPFNPSTKIIFSIPGNRNGIVTLKVYDLLGREVAVLVNDYRPAGNYEIDFNADQLSSGAYFYKLTSGSTTLTKKLLVIK